MGNPKAQTKGITPFMNPHELNVDRSRLSLNDGRSHRSHWTTRVYLRLLRPACSNSSLQLRLIHNNDIILCHVTDDFLKYTMALVAEG
jgi:hypothetical protein